MRRAVIALYDVYILNFNCWTDRTRQWLCREEAIAEDIAFDEREETLAFETTAALPGPFRPFPCSLAHHSL